MEIKNKTILASILITLFTWLTPLHAATTNVYGDVNGDGEVTIADVNAVIDVIMGDDDNPAADVNNDGEVNIADVNTVIDIILGHATPPVESFTVNGVTFKMIFVEGGTFMMGDNSSESDERPVHQVTLSDFSIGETEVTQALWMAVMETNPSHFTGDLQLPVESVSWIDCQSFITKLNQMTGKTFRLPTEAEWEYAARGGKWTHGYTYAGSNSIDAVAWYRYLCTRTRVIATKAPNELGLYDMSGNVYEWCQDKYSNYSGDAQVNPIGTSGSYNYVIRGGSWVEMGSSCRVSNRSYRYRGYHENDKGLRIAL